MVHPTAIQAVLDKVEGSYVTERGVEVKQPSGAIELLIARRGLEIIEPVSEEVVTEERKTAGRKPKKADEPQEA